MKSLQMSPDLSKYFPFLIVFGVKHEVIFRSSLSVRSIKDLIKLFSSEVMVCLSIWVAANVLELCLVRFWNTSLPKCLNKDTMFVDICKEKITVFPEGTLFANAGFPAIPSQQTPDTGGFPYFNGGYNTFNYTCLASGNSVNGLQIECDSTVRFGYLNRKKFADSTASVIVNYLNIHQNLNLLLDCGLTTTVKESENIIANSIKIFPNPARDVLQLAINDIHENYKTIIFSTVGEVVLEASNQNKLNVSKLAGGLYFVNVVLDNRTIWRSKIIIEK